MNLRLDEPAPPLFGRQAFTRETFALNRNELDDRIEGFYPQCSTHWDGLGHVRCREHGFWGGRDEEAAARELGIETWADKGIAGRGVLVDVDTYLRSVGRTASPLTSSEITVNDLRDTLAHQRTRLEHGDILCIRTGWLASYRRLSPTEKHEFAMDPSSIGLRADEEMARFLWDSGAAAVACDNPAVERVPGDPTVGSLHRRLLPCLGIVLGELFDLDKIALACHTDARWEFFFVSEPLTLPGGLGSPANALAIL
ncbi:cyclase family protein [Nocardia rhamnosiphila]|uniref:Cyclase family protein n=1 Tax=Nocardia rhamnosiphila TaxID=426716 RepID=A0ABV2X299_9NOCA